MWQHDRGRHGSATKGNFISLARGDESQESSDPDEENVFDLDVDTDSNSGKDLYGGTEKEKEAMDEEEEDDDEEEEEGEEEEEEEEEEEGGSGDEDGDDQEAELQDVRRWGKHKNQYYSADAVDLEIGQDFEEAEEEEVAAREVEQARYDEVEENDYLDGWNTDKNILVQKNKFMRPEIGMHSITKPNTQSITSGLSSWQESMMDQTEMEMAQLEQGLLTTSTAGKLRMLSTSSPELLTLLEDFKDKLSELQDRVEPLAEMARDGACAVRLNEEGVAYLEVKQQLLLNYCLNLTYYLLLKAEGRAVKDHPVIAQLVELRVALEKMRPLDAKLKYHLDRLTKVASVDGSSRIHDDPLSFRPNPDLLVGKRGQDRVEDGNGKDLDNAEGNGHREVLYRPPRLAAVPYGEKTGADGGRESKNEALARKRLEKLRRSELLQTLTEQYRDKPELVAEHKSLENSVQQRADYAEEERRIFEEERFTRLVTSRRDKKARRLANEQATRLETIADIGDFHELHASLNAFQNGAQSKASYSASNSNDREVKQMRQLRDKKDMNALQKAVNSIAQKEQMTKRQRNNDLHGDIDLPHRNECVRRVRRATASIDEERGDMINSAKIPTNARQKAIQVHHGDADEQVTASCLPPEHPLYKTVATSKSKRKAEKAALYAVEPQYGAVEDGLTVGAMGEGGKRGINHQMLKNRGLTAYKSKLNRNPRVKKREAYRKAVIKRKGQVRDVRESEAAHYGGEATGINAKVIRVRGKGT